MGQLARDSLVGTQADRSRSRAPPAVIPAFAALAVAVALQLQR